MIKAENLTKKFPNHIAVNDVNLEIKKGEIFAFLGTNGAGKTTTIRMLTGVLTPTAGRVEIAGYDITKDPIKAKSQMGIIPDRPYIYGKLTGNEFLSFMAELYRVPNKESEIRIAELLELYGLFDARYELIDNYSHGMKQRLLMCAAQIHNPPILIVDEPMVGLDPLGARLLKDTFRERAAQGMSIFMSTHSLSVAEEIADRLAIIKNGHILTTGTLEEIFARARNGASDLENAFLEIISEADSELRAEI